MKHAPIALKFIKSVTIKFGQAFLDNLIPTIVVTGTLVFLINRDFLENDISVWESFLIGSWLGPVVMALLYIFILVFFSVYIFVKGKMLFFKK